MRQSPWQQWPKQTVRIMIKTKNNIPLRKTKKQQQQQKRNTNKQKKLQIKQMNKKTPKDDDDENKYLHFCTYWLQNYYIILCKGGNLALIFYKRCTLSVLFFLLNESESQRWNRSDYNLTHLIILCHWSLSIPLKSSENLWPLNNHVVQTPLLLTIIPSLENTLKNKQFKFNFKLFPFDY